jgi:branched-chain amino acid transport system ATP-binding protein
MLEVGALTSHYGRIQALKGLDLTVREGELVALVGRTAPASRPLGAISGTAFVRKNYFQWQDIAATSAERRVGLGIVRCPEPAGIRPAVGRATAGSAPTPARAESDAELERVYAMFPALRERRRQAARHLSGGQQQMLAMGRGLMAKPRLLLLDEPSMGLAPRLVEEIFAKVRALKEAQTTIFLVDQNARAALAVADRGYVLETGRVVLAGPARPCSRTESGSLPWPVILIHHGAGERARSRLRCCRILRAASEEFRSAAAAPRSAACNCSPKNSPPGTRISGSRLRPASAAAGASRPCSPERSVSQ